MNLNCPQPSYSPDRIRVKSEFRGLKFVESEQDINKSYSNYFNSDTPLPTLSDINSNCCTSKLKILERRKARICQGLSPEPDNISERSISLKYEPFPKIKTKTELYYSRKLKDTSADFTSSLLGTFHTAEERLKNREQQYIFSPTSRKTFNQICQERRQQDMEYNQKIFGNVTIGIHGKDLPRFQDLGKLYLNKKLTEVKSQTPEPSVLIKRCTNSKSVDITCKPNQFNPYQIEEKSYIDGCSKFSRKSNLTKVEKLVFPTVKEYCEQVTAEPPKKKIRVLKAMTRGHTKETSSFTINTNYFRSSGFKTPLSPKYH